ncbi:hypothetical protein A1D31_37660 [Bradyrhizobium liaoningense]|nr:hypothetical protein A1D31_37660 [Bradyrhizobium liaoningense]
MHPSAGSILGDAIGSHFGKLALHFEEHRAPSAHRLRSRFDRKHERLKQFPTAHAGRPRGTIFELWESAGVFIAGVVDIGALLQHRERGQEVVAERIHKERIRGSVQGDSFAGQKCRDPGLLGDPWPHRFANFRLRSPIPVRIGPWVFLVTVRSLGADHFPYEQVAQLPPDLGRSGIILVLLHEPVVPASGKRDCVEFGERLALAIALGSQRRNARLYLHFPLGFARLCLVPRSVRRQLKVSLTFDAVEALVLDTNILGDAFAGKPSPIRSTT